MRSIIDALKNCNRKIVIHETCIYDDHQIIDNICQNDILFFDDCLYSQYVFLKRNNDKLASKNVTCIIGFSTSIFRRDNQTPIEFAHCASFHDRVHSGDDSAYAAYMSINDIKTLLEAENIILACHGDEHLDLHLEQSKMQKMKLFIDDICSATAKLDQLKLNTDVFVYPYAYDDILMSDHILRKNGFKWLFAGKDSRRISFESIIAGNPVLE